MKLKTYKDRKHKPTPSTDVNGTVFLGKHAKPARRLRAAVADWESGEGSRASHGHQKPGSLKV